MKKENRRKFCAAACMLLVFLLWTSAIQLVDVETIGPQESSVGFAALNRFVHHLTGIHMFLYTVTDWLGLVPIAVAAGFAFLGLIQWIRRKRLLKVDSNLLILGGFYMVVMAVYVLFELLVVNYRPVLINGCLEASYPSSTTMLVLCVMPTAVMQWNARIKNNVLKRVVTAAVNAFIVFMVVGRLVSGVHWFTDIVGSAFLSAGLVMMYRVIVRLEVGLNK